MPTRTAIRGDSKTYAASAMWSDIGVPDDSDDGEGSWLVVSTNGSGTWRGEVTW